MTEAIHGVVVVDKPVGPTSFAIVRQARLATGARKIGHGGTLDPLASGVLPLCFGEATKLAQFLLDADKEYEATVRFGVETDTYDAAGTVTARSPAEHLAADDVRRALARFGGEQQQIPPMYSALKREGRPLYAYARGGQTLERAARPVHIRELELRAFGPARPEASAPAGGASGAEAFVPEARIFVHCSKGTYVRSLAHDLGRAVGTGAHLTALRRIRSGPFAIEDAVRPEALGTHPLPLVSLADALGHLASATLSGEVVRAVVRGQRVTWGQVTGWIAGRAGDERLTRLLSCDGNLVAVARRQGDDDLVETIRVFPPENLGTRCLT